MRDGIDSRGVEEESVNEHLKMRDKCAKCYTADEKATCAAPPTFAAGASVAVVALGAPIPAKHNAAQQRRTCPAAAASFNCQHVRQDRVAKSKAEFASPGAFLRLSRLSCAPALTSFPHSLLDGPCRIIRGWGPRRSRWGEPNRRGSNKHKSNFARRAPSCAARLS